MEFNWISQIAASLSISCGTLRFENDLAHRLELCRHMYTLVSRIHIKRHLSDAKRTATVVKLFQHCINMDIYCTQFAPVSFERFIVFCTCFYFRVFFLLFLLQTEIKHEFCSGFFLPFSFTLFFSVSLLLLIFFIFFKFNFFFD